jgi:hypothetical protein
MPIQTFNFANIEPMKLGSRFSDILAGFKTSEDSEDRRIKNEGLGHQNTILGAEAQYAPDKFRFANAIQEAKARYAAEQEQADVQQKLAHAAYFKNGGASGNNDATSPKERRRLYNGLGSDGKAELNRLGSIVGWTPQQTQDNFIAGNTPEMEAENLNIDLSRHTGKTLATSKNRTDLNTRKVRAADLHSLQNAVSKDLSLYGATFKGYSPAQIIDALSGENPAEMIRFLGANALQPEIAAARQAISMGSTAHEAIRDAKEAALANFKIPGFTITPEVREGVQKYINEKLTEALKASENELYNVTPEENYNKDFSQHLQDRSNMIKLVMPNGKTYTVPKDKADSILANPKYTGIKVVE